MLHSNRLSDCLDSEETLIGRNRNTEKKKDVGRGGEKSGKGKEEAMRWRQGDGVVLNYSKLSSLVHCANQSC